MKKLKELWYFYTANWEPITALIVILLFIGIVLALLEKGIQSI